MQVGPTIEGGAELLQVLTTLDEFDKEASFITQVHGRPVGNKLDVAQSQIIADLQQARPPTGGR